MPAKNHDQLDAHHAARLELARQLERFKRRLYDDAQTAINAALAEGKFGPGHEYPDASSLGRLITEEICRGVIGIEPLPPVEAEALTEGDPEQGTPGT